MQVVALGELEFYKRIISIAQAEEVKSYQMFLAVYGNFNVFICSVELANSMST